MSIIMFDWINDSSIFSYVCLLLHLLIEMSAVLLFHMGTCDRFLFPFDWIVFSFYFLFFSFDYFCCLNNYNWYFHDRKANNEFIIFNLSEWNGLFTCNQNVKEWFNEIQWYRMKSHVVYVKCSMRKAHCLLVFKQPMVFICSKNISQFLNHFNHKWVVYRSTITTKHFHKVTLKKWRNSNG